MVTDETQSACEVHGPEPDPRIDPGAAIGWLELHYGDFTLDDDWCRMRIAGPMSRVCQLRQEPR